jgi:hypothetical protein
MEIHVAYMFLRTLRVYQVIYQHTARQPAKSPNSETRDSSFPYTAAFSAQQLSLHSQLATAQTNRPSVSQMLCSELTCICLPAKPAFWEQVSFT